VNIPNTPTHNEDCGCDTADFKRTSQLIVILLCPTLLQTQPTSAAAMKWDDSLW